jgi:hypothetical protein
MYATGGLEPTDEDGEEILEINNVNYVVNDKFKALLRNNIIDWGTFLEIYNNTYEYCDLVDQATKILDISNDKNQNQNVKDNILPILEKLYDAPPEHQIMCMMKQYFTYAPMSYAILDCFNMFKNHFENIVELFIETRNKYIKKNKLDAKTNSWDKLIKYWDNKNAAYDLNTSSLILLFINPPAPLESKIKYDLNNKAYEANNKAYDLNNKAYEANETNKAYEANETNKANNASCSDLINKLKNDISNFYYPGFCPKVPHIRLNNLLTFPLDSFIDTIKAFDKNIKFPDYNKIKTLINNILKDISKKPEIKIDLLKKTPPETSPETQDKTQLIKWYITEILENRKKLLTYGEAYENYYTQIAKKIIKITEEAKKILQNNKLTT